MYYVFKIGFPASCFIYSVITLSYFQTIMLFFHVQAFFPYSIHYEYLPHTFLCLYSFIIQVLTLHIRFGLVQAHGQYRLLSAQVSIGESSWFWDIPLMFSYDHFRLYFSFRCLSELSLSQLLTYYNKLFQTLILSLMSRSIQISLLC